MSAPTPASAAAKPAAAGAGASKDKDSDDEEEVEQLQYKVVILGDGAVGKTSLTSRFCEDYFAATYKQTIGVDWFIKRVVLPGDVHVALQIWDIGGQTIGSKMVSNYIYGAQAVILVYDITNYQSFQDLEDWLALVKKTFENEQLPYIALCGNKIDLQHLRAVKADKHASFADDHSLYSYFVSAKSGDHVAQAFYRVAADLAGVVLSKGDIEQKAKVVQAEIVNHQQNDPNQPKLVLKEEKQKCVVQ